MADLGNKCVRTVLEQGGKAGKAFLQKMMTQGGAPVVFAPAGSADDHVAEFMARFAGLDDAAFGAQLLPMLCACRSFCSTACSWPRCGTRVSWS